MLDGITASCNCISANARKLIEDAIAERIIARVDLLGVLEDEKVPSTILSFLEAEIKDLNETMTMIRGIDDC